MVEKLSVAILDMQPIDPPVGGGRLRLLGLYHALGDQVAAHYVGTYDWPGEKPRDHWLTPTLRETLVPLSNEHFAAASELSIAAGGKTVIDAAFALHAHLSPAFLDAARAAAAAADVVVYSHPWIHPLTADVCDRSRQLVVYDAHNVEARLRMQLLDDGAAGTEIVRHVVETECMLCRAADLVLACSQDDAEAFARFYGTSEERIRIVPNGTFTARITPATLERRMQARKRFGLDLEPVALFIGTPYGPNIDAANFIAEELAPSLPDIVLVVAGAVGDVLRSKATPANVRIPGQLSEADKLAWFDAADIAINPMFSGSGTNIKMLDFLAAGLPTVSTPTGARGIVTAAPAFRLAERKAFADAAAALLKAEAERKTLAAVAREQATRFYSWERISPSLGRLLTRQHMRRNSRPKFSVVIATYERPQHLSNLVGHLAAQRFRDFEVIIVDQSAAPWAGRDQDHGFDLCYVHSETKGVVTARNAGAALACGEIIAFTDDDCVPPPSWLEAAATRFDAEPIAGLEGLIISERENDPDYRPVTNYGFEGMGFMTANLFVRTDVFRAVGGFDIAFDHPSFREDTDLGWRVQAHGAIPFSHEAWTFHPAHRRDIQRESLPERSRFFVNDAKLLRKHGDRYIDLFHAERQWKHNPYFIRYFMEGLEREGVEVPDAILATLREQGITDQPGADAWSFRNAGDR